MKLYEIEQQHRQVIEAIIEAGGELTPELEQALTLTLEDLQEKAVAYALVIREQQGDLAQITALITSLQAKKKRLEAGIDRVEKRIRDAMIEFGVDKVKVPLVSIWIQHTERLSILNEGQIPLRFVTVVTENKVDAKALKAAIKAGEIPDDVAVLEPNTTLRVQ